LKSYWRSVLFGVVVVLAMRLTSYLFPYGRIASLFGRSTGHLVALLAFNAVIVLAVIPIIWKLFKS
jgi:hypothetical protein